MRNKSELKFVEWSQAISDTDYDVKAMKEIIGNISSSSLRGLDIGGGMGRFAAMVSNGFVDCKITVVDNSELVRDVFVSNINCELIEEDWFHYKTDVQYDFILFKTVLHHFVEDNEEQTLRAQIEGLNKAKHLLKDDGRIIVEENFYEPLFCLDDLSGRLIYEITKLKFIEKLTRKLGANTAGEGVRFRSMGSWKRIFKSVGLRIDKCYKNPWDWQTWQRLPLFGRERFQAVVSLSKQD